MAQTAENRFSNVLFYGVVLCLAYFVFRCFSRFWRRLAWAAVFGVIFYSLNKRFERKWGQHAIGRGDHLRSHFDPDRSGPSASRAVCARRDRRDPEHPGDDGRRGIWLVRPRLGTGWSPSIAAAGVTVDLPGLVRQGASSAGEYMASELGAVIRNIVVFVFELFVMLFALFYFLRDGDSILARFRLFLPFEEAMRDAHAGGGARSDFRQRHDQPGDRRGAGIDLRRGLCDCGPGFSPCFWGVLMAFLSLLPVVGAWPVWIPAASGCSRPGIAGRAVILIVICGGLGATIDNILRPVLLGGRASLNGLLVFISVLGGIAVFGVLGVVLGPIVVATAVGILDVYSGTDTARTCAGDSFAVMCPSRCAYRIRDLAEGFAIPCRYWKFPISRLCARRLACARVTRLRRTNDSTMAIKPMQFARRIAAGKTALALRSRDDSV